MLRGMLQGTHNVANLQKIMTRIGGVCLITIGVWCIIELGVQFGHYNHSCYLGEGEHIYLCEAMSLLGLGTRCLEMLIDKEVLLNFV